ncbi:phasin family protein [Dechloromonas sp. H13]|uniref:phasin family protein n=1 Tax=Dechloromonas sp. H13 TaxID=2570193 RepID=UPI00129109A9|nr:phasin family protein [Dechloromonas sp. H13]
MSNNESNEHFLAANKTVIDAMTSATRAILAATESLVTLNLETAREAFDASAENAQAVLSSKNPQEAAAAMQSALGKAAVEKAAAYSRGVYEVSTKAASELGSLFQIQFEELTKVSQEIAQKAAKAAPFGADLAQAAAKQAAQLSESYITAVTSVMQTAGAKGKK